MDTRHRHRGERSVYAFAPIWPSLATLARSVAVDASLIMDWLAGRYRAAAARGSTAAVMSPATDGDNDELEQ